jgi:hypothetical protein
MKILVTNLLTLIVIALFFIGCTRNKETGNLKVEKDASVIDTGLIVVAKDIITEVVVNQVPDGDPWEAEKIAGYNGKVMIDKLFKDIYNQRLTVYDYHSGLELTPNDVKKLEKEFNSDRSLIGKIQFTEDWYLDPRTDGIKKDIKSIVFGAELKESSGNVYGYKALFQIKLK